MGNLQDKVSSLQLQDRVTSLKGRTKGLFSEFGNTAPRVLLLGLDGAGKTSLLYKAKLNSTMFANVPPIGINIEEMTPKRGATIAVWDMRGDKLHRHLWRNYYQKTDAIVFVVDSSDKVRLDEAQYELSQMLQTRYLSKVPVVVAANKQDAEGEAKGADGPDEVAGLLNLGEIKDRHWSIFGTNSQKGKGIQDVFKEVVRLIKLTRKEKLQRKSEMLKKHNDDHKENKDTEIEVKVPPLDLDISDDSVKKHSLFESINKSNSSSDGDENKSNKSDQYDTLFDDNPGNCIDSNAENAHNDNTSFNDNRDTQVDEMTDDKAKHEPGTIKGVPNIVPDSYDRLSDSGTDKNDESQNVYVNGESLNDQESDIPRTEEDQHSVSEVKVTDLDSDSDASLPDNNSDDHQKNPDEANLCY